MGPLWTAQDAVAATGGKSSCDWTASGVSIDTRTLKTGDLFVALEDIRDGHDFVAQALKKGASAALVSRVPEGVPSDAALLVVDNVLGALEALASAARARIGGKVIAVTGSVGKTGTKEMLRTALEPQGIVHAAEKSYNNHWGVPLTLARMPEDTDYAIIEIGMNHAGEIAPLSRIAQPDVAIVTNVAAVHMAAFENINQIAREKASIVEGLRDGGCVVLNADLETSSILADAVGDVPTVWFGENGSDVKLRNVSIQNDETVVEARVFGRELQYEIGAAGKHLAMNSLAVLAAVHAVGADVNKAASGLKKWHPPSGRGERWVVNGINLIDDSYNANPLSMSAALDVLANTKGKRIAFLGDMLELGVEEMALHRALASNESLNEIDTVHCVGPLMRRMYDALPDGKKGVWVEKSVDIASQIGTLLEDGDVAMVKGSLGAKMGLIVDAIKNLGDARPLNETGGKA